MNEEARNLLAQAHIQSDFGRKAETTALLLRALALDPNDSALLCHLAASYSQTEQWEEMLSYAEKAVATSPDAEWPHRLHSIALRNLKRLEEALSAANEAARHKPSEPLVLVHLAETLRMCGDDKEAEAVCFRLMQIAPENVKAHLILTHIYTSLCRWPDVEKYARLGLQIDAEQAKLHRRLGEAMTAQGQNAEAIQAYASALQIEPVDAKTRKAFREECVTLGINSFPSEVIFVCTFPVILLLQQRHMSVPAIIGTTLLLSLLPMTALALLMRVKPSLFLSLQRGYRKLPVVTQRLVAQQCQTSWSAFGIGLFQVVIACLMTFVLGIVKSRSYPH